jgi:hypothetical protein
VRALPFVCAVLIGCPEGDGAEDAAVRREAGVGRPDGALPADAGEPDAEPMDAAVQVDAAIDAGTSDAEPGDASDAGAADASPADAGDAGMPQRFVISEVSYDFTSGADVGRDFVELAGPAGAPLIGMELEIVGGTGAVLATVALTGSMPADGFFVLASETTAGMSLVPNADQVAGFDLPASGGVRLTGALDGFGWGYAIEGAPVPAITADLHPASWARSNDLADTDDNLADFRHDPTPTPGAPNGFDAFAVALVDPDDAIAGLGTSVRVEGTDFTDAMAVEVGGETLTCTAMSVTVLDCALPYPAGGSGLAERVDVVVRARPEHGGVATLPGAFTWTAANNETNAASECDYCVLQFPATTTALAGVATELIFGQIYEAGLTDTTGGRAPGILAELGVGPAGTDPRASNAWTWQAAIFNVEVGNNDEYMNTITAGIGTYAYAFRFSLDGGLTWSYADTTGAGSNGGLDFEPSALGVLTVN